MTANDRCERQEAEASRDYFFAGQFSGRNRHFRASASEVRESLPALAFRYPRVISSCRQSVSGC
ncbi:MAG: hypothetical protein MZV63_69420 [Marinilabiliales bacterium]|nr:hypothetical protein [Marinilabiliales bacterium]